MDLAARIGPGAETEESEEFDGSVLGRGPGPVAISSAADKVTVGVALVVVGVAFDCPGRRGIGSVRSSAWIWGPLVDQQNDRPRGRAGGEPADVGHPATSSGSRLNANVSVRCGWRQPSRQIRRIVFGLAPIALCRMIFARPAVPRSVVPARAIARQGFNFGLAHSQPRCT